MSGQNQATLVCVQLPSLLYAYTTPSSGMTSTTLFSTSRPPFAHSFIHSTYLTLYKQALSQGIRPYASTFAQCTAETYIRLTFQHPATRARTPTESHIACLHQGEI